MGGSIVIGIFLLVNSCVSSLDPNSFPDNFMFGVASSAYQTEGAWNTDGKGESIWDYYMHENSSGIQNEAGPDTAADSYHKYKEDVELIRSMNLKLYKFSLSWTRILPSGFNDSINTAGINYYKNVISELQKNGITPMVTLYHWDLPQSIQDQGGWTDEKTIQYFVDYARVAFQSFSGVEYWITIHEPKQVCRGGYGNGSLAPFIWDTGISDYKCAYIILKAHAAVYHMYKSEFPELTGKISIALDGSWSEPFDNTKNNLKAAKRRNEFEFGLYANPIFVKGWPQMVEQIVENNSKKPYFNTSRLPAFTPEEKLEIKSTADFMALNYYGARGVKHLGYIDPDRYEYDTDLAVEYWKNKSWTEMPNGLSIVPWSIQSFTSFVKNTYGDLEMIITGNGVADEDLIHDSLRMNYISDHLQYILKAINEDNVNITGYIYCNLLDSFEWNEGYRSHYGLFGVDITSFNKTRYVKDSVGFYRRIASKSDISTTSTHIPKTSSVSEPTSTSTDFHTDTTITVQSTTCSDISRSSGRPPTEESSSSERTRSSDSSTLTTPESTTITTSRSSTSMTDNFVTSTTPSTHSGSLNMLGTSIQLLAILTILLEMYRRFFTNCSVNFL